MFDLVEALRESDRQDLELVTELTSAHVFDSDDLYEQLISLLLQILRDSVSGVKMRVKIDRTERVNIRVSPVSDQQVSSWLFSAFEDWSELRNVCEILRVDGQVIEGALVLSLPPQRSESREHDERACVLIVEDTLDVAGYMEEILEDDYRVVHATDGESALREIASELPDLVLSDIMMPNLDGIELLKKIRTDPSTIGIPFMFVTARTDSRSKIAGLELGAVDYLTKPFDAGELKARVGTILEFRAETLRQATKHVGKGQEVKPLIQSRRSRFEAELADQLLIHHADADLTVERLASILATSASQLRRLTRSYYGVTPGEYIRLYRLERAKVLLQSDYGNVSEVAYSVGFKSLSYFSRRYRERFGVRPSDVPNTSEAASGATV